LKEVEIIYKSEAVLAVSPKVTPDVQKLIDTLKFRIESVLRARKSKYILMNVYLMIKLMQLENPSCFT
jgi:ATP phosphoribosyltransferase